MNRLAELVPRRRPRGGRDVVTSVAAGARRGPLWRQLPAYSPLTLHAAWRAATQALRGRDDPRPRVERLLRALYPAREAVLLWRGSPLGSHGALSVLSFGRGKGWTGGRGGALLMRRFPLDGHLATARSPGLSHELAALGSATAQSLLGRPALYRLPAAIPFLHLGETRYRAPSAPRGMTRAAAALLERTLPLATREAAVRKANAEALLARIPPDSRVRAVAPPRAGTPGFLRLPLRVPNGLAGLPDPRLARRLGVTPGYPTTLAAPPPVRERLTRASGRWPGAEELVRQLVTLPTHSLVSAAEREALARLVERCS